MLSGKPATPSPAHHRTGANHANGVRGLAGVAARELVARAVRVREHLVRTGHTPLTPELAARLDRLNTWLRYNLTPSTGTLCDFWAGPLGQDLRAIVTRNKAGHALLLRFSSSITQ